MTTNTHTILTALANDLPTRTRAARHAGVDCVRLTLAEAEAVRRTIARTLDTNRDQQIAERRHQP